ncbi:hypothetical protein GGX14DRAFT_566904 [Mycena pura]|uniref:Uncharacterized protein n=1 Tax=Mycena pura TaxID=153505 RepID=A0AAD6VIN1_9AGAR|nr:hypothetical protein GGX14DRAFT_566904 [Mycena pura]
MVLPFGVPLVFSAILSVLSLNRAFGFVSLTGFRPNDNDVAISCLSATSHAASPPRRHVSPPSRQSPRPHSAASPSNRPKTTPPRHTLFTSCATLPGHYFSLLGALYDPKAARVGEKGCSVMAVCDVARPPHRRRRRSTSHVAHRTAHLTRPCAAGVSLYRTLRRLPRAQTPAPHGLASNGRAASFLRTFSPHLGPRRAGLRAGLAPPSRTAFLSCRVHLPALRISLRARTPARSVPAALYKKKTAPY